MSCVTKTYPSAARKRLDGATTVSPAMPYGVRVMRIGKAGRDPRGSQMLVLRRTPSRTGIITNRQLNDSIAGDACCAVVECVRRGTNSPMAVASALLIHDLVWAVVLFAFFPGSDDGNKRSLAVVRDNVRTSGCTF